MNRFRIPRFYRIVIVLWLLILSVIALPILALYSHPAEAVCLSGIDAGYSNNLVDTRRGILKIVTDYPALSVNLRDNVLADAMRENQFAYVSLTSDQLQMEMTVLSPAKKPIRILTDFWPSLKESPASLIWSSDNRYLLLINSSQLGIFDTVAAQYRDIPLSALDLTEGQIGRVGWSPAGHWLLHLIQGPETEAANGNLVAYDLDTGTTRTLATNVTDYRLSPDLKHLLIARPVATDETRLDYFIDDLDTGKEMPLLTNAGELNSYDPVWLDNSTLLLNLSGDLVWTKTDGSQMHEYRQPAALTLKNQPNVWAIYISEGLLSPYLVLMDTKTGTLKSYPLKSPDTVTATISPDSQWIAVAAIGKGSTDISTIQVIAVETGQTKTLTIPNELPATAIWLPDNQGFAVMTTYNHDNEFAIHLLRPDTSEIHQMRFPNQPVLVDHWSNCAPYK